MEKIMIGQFLKEKRLKRRMTLRNFCLKYELDSFEISKIERNVKRPNKRDFKKLSKAYLVDIEIFYKNKKIKKPKMNNIYNKNFSIKNKLPVFIPNKTNINSLVNLIKSSYKA